MKWRNEEVSKNGKIRLVFISVSVAILIAVSVFVSVIYLAPLYKKYFKYSKILYTFAKYCIYLTILYN